MNGSPLNEELIPHLFRTEYRKIASVLCKRFGFEQIEIAEDIASETFLTAFDTWRRDGVPANPTAWLYAVAKNKARNHLQRNLIFENKVAPELRQFSSESAEEEIDLSPHNINDSQLQMMFAICTPEIPMEAQIGLSLRILCGFGIEEIADAFLTNKETVNKRLFRAREKLRHMRRPIALPAPAEIDARLGMVLRTIYLLFTEGYYSVSNNVTLRKDLCLEAMRLCMMLVENSSTNRPEVNALLSLICFHASRFAARSDGQGVLYRDQDPSLWDAELIQKGEYFLNCSATGTQVTRYHFEAAIAYWHTCGEGTEGKWENILRLYDQLLQLEYSPVAALNRAYALSRVAGKEAAIIEAEKHLLDDNHLSFVLLGELYTDIDDAKAVEHLERALALARTDTDRRTIRKRIDALARRTGGTAVRKEPAGSTREESEEKGNEEVKRPRTNISANRM